MTKVILSWPELRTMLKEQFKASKLELDEDGNVTMEIDLEDLKKKEQIYIDRPYPIIVDRPYPYPYPHWRVTCTSSKTPTITYSSSSK